MTGFRFCCVIGLAILGHHLASTVSRAGNWWSAVSSPLRCCDRPVCCDDYCRRPAPCVAPNCDRQCDTYCRKPLPCVAPKKQFCDDCYGRKPTPCVPCPVWTEHHRCPPPAKGKCCQPGCD